MIRKYSTYKVPDGKLLRISFLLDSAHRVFEVRICGDFFFFPEDAFLDLEKALSGVLLDDVATVVDSFIVENAVSVIGFTGADVWKAMHESTTK